MKRNKTKKSRKKQMAGDYTQMPLKSLETKAQALIAAAKWRDAIIAYKELVKRQPDERYLDFLAQAYRGRAEALLAKGYFKEALIIAENMRQVCGERGDATFSIEILFQARRWKELAEMYRSDLAADTKQAMEPCFAAAMLAGEITPGHLPSDSAVETGFETASNAIDAYCRNRDEDARNLLRAIPFRSPYRDFSLILKALLCRHADPDQAHKYLDRVSPDSAFSALVQGAEQASADPLLFWRQKKKGACWRWASKLRGWSEERLTFLRQLATKSTEKQVNSLLKSSIGLDPKLVRQFCEANLPHVPVLIDLYCKKFQVKKGDRHRLLAQYYECHDMPEGAIEEWQSYADHLEANRALSPRRSREIAEVYRHMGGLQEIELDVDYSYSEYYSYLDKSLDYDSCDKETYKKLLVFLKDDRSAAAKKERNRLLEDALLDFPDEPYFLTMMVDVVSARSAFKKASGYAFRLLELDPKNVENRNRLVLQLLGHTNKQIKAGRLSAAQKVLEQVRETARGCEMAQIIPASQALIFVLQGHEDRAKAELASNWDSFKMNPAARIALLLECRAVGVDHFFKSKMKGWVKTLNKTQATQEAILRFMKPILDKEELKYGDADLLVELDRFFTSGAQLPLAQNVFKDLCDGMERYGFYRFLTAYARQGWRQFKQPIFQYFEVIAKTEDGEKPMTDKQHHKLLAALDTAKDQEDEETVGLITMLLVGQSPSVRGMEPADIFNIFNQIIEEGGLPDGFPFNEDGCPF